MTAADIEGSAGKMSSLSGSRLANPFENYVIREGYHTIHGYVLRHPNHGGHWLSLLPASILGMADPTMGALLCDSLYPAPFVLTFEQTEQLSQASAVDAATNLSDFNSDFGCFLVGQRI